MTAILKSWTYLGRRALMVVNDANRGIAASLTAKGAVEIAYGDDPISETVRNHYGIWPAVELEAAS